MDGERHSETSQRLLGLLVIGWLYCGQTLAGQVGRTGRRAPSSGTPLAGWTIVRTLCRLTTIRHVLLARLAVDVRGQGRGLGAALFRDAIARAVGASERLGTLEPAVHTAMSTNGAGVTRHVGLALRAHRRQLGRSQRAYAVGARDEQDPTRTVQRSIHGPDWWMYHEMTGTGKCGPRPKWTGAGEGHQVRGEVSLDHHRIQAHPPRGGTVTCHEMEPPPGGVAVAANRKANATQSKACARTLPGRARAPSSTAGNPPYGAARRCAGVREEFKSPAGLR